MATKTRSYASARKALRARAKLLAADAEALAIDAETLAMTSTETVDEVPARMASCAAAILRATSDADWQLELPLNRHGYSATLHLGWFGFIRAMVDREAPNEQQAAAGYNVAQNGASSMQQARAWF
jgi:hypothetical protein